MSRNNSDVEQSHSHAQLQNGSYSHYRRPDRRETKGVKMTLPTHSLLFKLVFGGSLLALFLAAPEVMTWAIIATVVAWYAA